MSNSDLSLINAALTRTGNSQITSLDDADAAATVATANYEIMVLAELARSRFKLPTKMQQLSLLDEDEIGAVPEPWSYAYQLPSDLVKLRTVMVGGFPIEFEQMGRIIYCDYGSDNEVYAKYGWRIPEDWWAPEFVEGIVRKLEALFLRSLNEDYDKAEVREAMADEQLKFARAADAQAETPKQPVGSTTLRARGNGPQSQTLRMRRT